jgi:isoquinoline 1-oxidoreductase subunit alpha
MELRINSKNYLVDADGDTPLLWVLRDELELTGTKYGCGLAQCGACTVMVDSVAVRSCVMPVDGIGDRSVTTIEWIENDHVGRLVVAAWVKHQVPQCGYCQSGQVIAATALLKHNSHPTDEQIDAAMVNLCRCGTYNAIRAAIHELAERINAVDVGGVTTPARNPETRMAVATLALASPNAVTTIKGHRNDEGKSE